VTEFFKFAILKHFLLLFLLSRFDYVLNLAEIFNSILIIVWA